MLHFKKNFFKVFNAFLDDDAVSVQYQFVFVANVIWNFGLDDLKPLSMFNTQEANMFFQVRKTCNSTDFKLYILRTNN